MEKSTGSVFLNANSRISDILDCNERVVIDTLSAFNKNFNRLRNPILKKLLSKRVTVAQACRIAGCTLNDFFETLRPLGFRIVHKAAETEPILLPPPVNLGEPIELDVRPVLNKGNDPLKLILEVAAKLKADEVLKVINSFEPIPLISLLKSKGYDAFMENAGQDLVYTYFIKKSADANQEPVNTPTPVGLIEFDELMNSYELQFIDVSGFEMPKPMMMILNKLDNLESKEALYVRHHKIPVHLLPVLKERGFDFRVKEINGEVILLIFRP